MLVYLNLIKTIFLNIYSFSKILKGIYIYLKQELFKKNNQKINMLKSVKNFVLRIIMLALLHIVIIIIMQVIRNILFKNLVIIYIITRSILYYYSYKVIGKHII